MKLILIRFTHWLYQVDLNYGYYEDAYNIEFLKIIREFKSQNKIIASVCVGALPLAKSGV